MAGGGIGERSRGGLGLARKAQPMAEKYKKKSHIHHITVDLDVVILRSL